MPDQVQATRQTCTVGQADLDLIHTSSLGQPCLEIGTGKVFHLIEPEQALCQLQAGITRGDRISTMGHLQYPHTDFELTETVRHAVDAGA
ncbi:hypothetical protein D3C80_1693570 [compost metagenome]